MNNVGTLYIIAAPSGGGKTSLVNALLKVMDNIKVSISYTTRPQRPGEQDGINYHFVSPEEFQLMVKKQIFLEHAFVHSNYYGTSKEWVEAQLKAGIDVILEIDWQGAQQARKLFPRCVGIFIIPPSREILKARLRERKQDHPDVITKRLAVASDEISHYAEFDYLIVNDQFEQALADLKAIVRSERLRLSGQVIAYKQLLANLIKNE